MLFGAKLADKTCNVDEKILAQCATSCYKRGMATKILHLVAELVKAGFSRKGGGKGSHRKYEHASGVIALICGKDGDDAKPYLIKEVRAKISKAKGKGA